MDNGKTYLERLYRICKEDFNQTWVEGYLSALADAGIITEDQFDEYMEILSPSNYTVN